jgi:archaellin
MIKNIMIIVLLSAVAFLINIYYKKSSIKLENNRVILNVKDKSIFLDYSLEESGNLTFSNVNILQKKLNLKGNSTFLEVVTADALYELNENGEFIVKTIFEAKKINTIFSINGLRAMEVVLRNERVINLFMENNYRKELIFFYGLSTNSFIKSIEKLQTREATLLYQNSIDSLSKPVTHWGVEHNDIDGVVQSIDY